MPRVRWSLVALALLALPLVSCFHDVGDCVTCPPENGGSIAFGVPLSSDLDSARVGLNGPAIHLVRRGQGGRFVGLPQGTHTLNAITYRSDINGAVQTKTSSIRIVLDRGELRVVEFHHDFPLVTWAPPAEGPAEARIATAPSHPPGRAG